MRLSDRERNAIVSAVHRYVGEMKVTAPSVIPGLIGAFLTKQGHHSLRLAVAS